MNNDLSKLIEYGLPVSTLEYSRNILRGAVEEWKPKATFALFSGGHDSLSATSIAFDTIPVTAAVHVNTTIGVEETREFVRETCREHGWPLIELFPPVSYREIVKKHGFPGPAGHAHMYRQLKERCLRQLVRDNKRHYKDQFLLVSGARREESVRRMGVVAEVKKEPGSARVWTNPIIEWNGTDKNTFISGRGLKRNEVVDILCMSGECGCGAFAKPGELEYIRKFFPAFGREIDSIACDVKAAGKPCNWGMRPDGIPNVGPDGGVPRCGRRPRSSPTLDLCFSCEAKVEREANAKEATS